MMNKPHILKSFNKEYFFTLGELIASIAGAVLGVVLVLFSKRK